MRMVPDGSMRGKSAEFSGFRRGKQRGVMKHVARRIGVIDATTASRFQ